MTEDTSVLTRAVAAPDRVVAYGEHPEQLADVRFGRAGEANPLIVIVHGGFWRPQYGRDQAGPMAAALAADGWTVAAIGYRRIPGEPDASVEDVRLAIERLATRVPQHDGRVIAVGHSAGGHLVLLSGIQAPSVLAGVLTLAPAADLPLAHELALGGGAVQAFLGGEPTSRPDLDPRRAAALRVPTHILHGDVDAVVPLSVSESFLQMHPEVSIERLANVGHFALIDPLSNAWSRVGRALMALGAPSLNQRTQG